MVAEGLQTAARPKVHRRGKCSRFGVKQSRALRQFLMLYEVSGSPVWAVTLTVRGCYYEGPEWFRNRVARLRNWVVRGGLGVVWRIELHRSRIPHLHLVVWGDYLALEGAWLDVCGMQHDSLAVEHACKSRAAGAGWFGYVAVHNGKGGYQSDGWQGRYWGVWGRELFVRRPVETFPLGVDYDRVFRIVNWLLRRRFGRRLNYLVGFDHFGLDAMTVRRIVGHVRSRELKKCPL